MNYKSFLLPVVLTAYSSLALAVSPKNLDCHTEASYAEGFPQREVCIADRDGDGFNDYQARRHYNFIGNLVLNEIDRNFDGSIDSRTKYNYDIIGRKISMTLDRNNDGSDEVVCTWEYNPNDQVVRSGCDFDGDGIEDRVTVRNYSVGGHLLRIRKYAHRELMSDEQFPMPEEMMFSSRELDL